ncbi:MAG: IS30 family transposase [Eggerthellaceae bacterium]|nr:IS30 family transposase [Eggerthellaceae bacterium]
MPESKGKHLTLEDRQVIEDAIRDGLGCREAARRLHVAPSTVSREVEQNRMATLTKRKDFKPGRNCARFDECEEIGTACNKCSTYKTRCRSCKTRKCIDVCAKFEMRTCPDTRGWPWTCPPKCEKSGHCNYPRMRYSAQAAQNSYEARLVSAREGVAITPEQMAQMMLTVDKLVKQGWSIEAIYAVHGPEMPVGIRTCYTYIDKGFAGVSNIDLPRKVRYKPRKSKKDPGRDRVDRTGRTFDDFKALPIEEQVRVVQADSVVGFEWNVQSILTLHLVRHSFQLYLLQAGLAAELTVAAFDAIETYLGSPEAFEAIFGIILADRGVEFDDWAGMERSYLKEGARRCRVFYCDPMRSDQKAEAEKNHEELRRVLPKGRSDFDALDQADVAAVCSHVNSYPRPARKGKCPYDLAAPELPAELLGNLGIVRVPPDEVLLRPALVAHAVEL